MNARMGSPNGDSAGMKKVISETEAPVLIAYRVSAMSMRLVPAPSARDWMQATREHFANRCLPLLVANQAGWFILNSHPFRVTWTGGHDAEDLQIKYLSGEPPYPAVTHFGYGLLTWHIPYLFRTSPGYNLLARGPANMPKDGACPLEGVVETDWSVAAFTMNWKITRPNHPVMFDIDEPICMLVPQRRKELESFEPKIRGIDADPDLRRRYEVWHQSRRQFLTDLRVPGSDAVVQRWEKDYFQGTAPDGLRAPEHQTKLKLRDFDERE